MTTTEHIHSRLSSSEVGSGCTCKSTSNLLLLRKLNPRSRHQTKPYFVVLEDIRLQCGNTVGPTEVVRGWLRETTVLQA